jgi:hypothetical protein
MAANSFHTQSYENDSVKAKGVAVLNITTSGRLSQIVTTY